MDHLNKGSWYDALSCFNTPDQDPEGVWMMSKAGGETGCLLLSGHDASKHPWRRQVSSAAEAEKPSGEQRDDSSSGIKSLSPGWETEYGMGQGLEWTHLSISVLSWKNKGHDSEKHYKQEANMFLLWIITYSWWMLWLYNE